jgi:hypothetical protein
VKVGLVEKWAQLYLYQQVSHERKLERTFFHFFMELFIIPLPMKTARTG